MDLRRMRYFAAIVEHGSISRAAEALRVAQPALSLHLKRLEEELGTQLVLRTPRGIVPTENGRRLAQRSAALIEEIEALRAEVRGLEAEPAGPAVVGIPTSLGPLLTVPMAMEVRRRHPAVQLRMVEGLSGHMLEWLRLGQVDWALVFGDEPAGGLETEPVVRERLGLVAPLGDPLLAGRDSIGVAELARLPLILPGRPHGVREETERAARAAGVALNVVLEIDALEQIKSLVAEGAGYTVLSARVARHGADAPRLTSLPIAAPAIERSIQLAHAAHRPLPLAARAVRAIAREQLAALTVEGRWREG
ncbi:LysR family transcriptional regulator [Azospirillum sp. SYSU D00513]|uniref:LysR family transcriptional regulator n=1 Tax=Azospirillum sp. SYSU D00513 TaxID=2812561 RepID=UPI001A959FA6|nr:LysR family transcriptional regulator [Azospirillum sp. SYSU D00513]